MGSLSVRLLQLPRLAANATLTEEGVFARPKGLASFGRLDYPIRGTLPGSKRAPSQLASFSSMDSGAGRL
jgi:hypothetical protein